MWVCRVSAFGSNWIEFERAVPYDLRLKWKPVVHTFQPTVQNSGIEGFNIEFPWSEHGQHAEETLPQHSMCPALCSSPLLPPSSCGLMLPQWHDCRMMSACVTAPDC